MNILRKLFTAFFHRRAAPRSAHLRAGEWGEELAARMLKQKKYRILGRRVRVGIRDELDLVCRSPDDVLVFIEVKTRASEDFGRPFSAVDARKRKALARASWNYVKKIRPRPDYFRFDVVEVVGAPGQGTPEIRHIENAFSLLGKKRIGW